MNRRFAASFTFLLLLLPAELFAHAHLRGSDPAAGTRLSSAPRSITLEFTENPELAFTTVTLTRPDGSLVQLGAPARSPASAFGIKVEIQSSLVAGKYLVSWRTAASDGHPTNGSFDFVVLPGAMGIASASTTTVVGSSLAAGSAAVRQRINRDGSAEMIAAASSGTESSADVIVRWLDFTGVVMLVGAAGFRQLVIRRLRGSQTGDSQLIPEASRNAARCGKLAATLLLITAVARLAAETYAMHGAAGVFNPAILATMILGTKWGLVWLIRLGATLLALVGFRAAEKRTGSRAWTLATFAVLLLALMVALGGHAASSPRLRTVAVLADATHVLGAGGWLGSLFLVVVAGIPAALRLQQGQERGEAAARVIDAFSPAALVSSALIVATGVFAGWLHVGSLAELWRSSYGEALLIKVGLFCLVAFAGAYHWRRAKTRLGDPGAAESLRKTAGLELLGGLIVIFVTAVLVALPTPASVGP